MESMATCSIIMDDGTKCTRSVLCRGMCSAHYSRLRTGKPLGELPLRAKAEGKCRLCDRPANVRGMCTAHYQRFYVRVPSPGVKRIPLDSPVRLKGKSDEVKVKEILTRAIPIGSCLHAADIGHDGYATSVKDSNGKSIKTHRLVYRVMVGEPGPLQVHHACGNRACIKPDHLVLATQLQNTAEMHARHAYETRIAELEAEVARLRAQLER